MKKPFLLILIAGMFIFACKSAKKENRFNLPEAGTYIPAGAGYRVKLDFAQAPDSVVYLVDSTQISTRKDTAGFTASSEALTMGNHLLTARIYDGGVSTETSTNIVVVPAKAPASWSYEIVNTFPHDTASFTEGLEYHDGILYESDGLNGESSLRTAELKTGKVINKVDLPDEYFAEGITVIGDKIIQLTYQEATGFVYDKKTLNKISEFPYTVAREGWGLAFDGEKILATDGSNTIYFLDSNTYQRTGSIEVYDNKGPVNSLNELEMIDGKIFANIWQKDIIVVIDPHSGAVDAVIDLSKLYPGKTSQEDVLNGIAWDAAGRRLFVTGKKWKKLFEIRLNK
jgi:glutamine cyclotransferase